MLPTNFYTLQIQTAQCRPRSTQPGHPFIGRRNEYQPKGGDILRLGSKGRYGSCVWVAGRTVWSPCYTRPISERLSSGASHNKVLYKYPDYSYSYRQTVVTNCNCNTRLAVNQRRTTHEQHTETCFFWFLFLWPWHWPDNVAIRPWPGYFEDIQVYQTKNWTS